MSIASIFHRLLQQLKGFARSESGMTLPLLAISMVAVTGFVGIAIDTGRMQMVQSKLQFSLDAAGLAAGSTISTASLNTETTKYLNTNFNGYLGATLTGSSVTASNNNTVFNLSATATVPTSFLGVVGVNTITVTANSQITRAVTGLELVLVLDNTGSMSNSAGGSVSKLAALQSASTTLVNTLFGGNSTSTNGKLWVGIVPFSQAVNIGTNNPNWMDATYNATLTDWGPGGSWFGCVDARQSGEDIIDDPPAQSSTRTLFRDYYWTSDNLNGDGVSNAGYNIWKTPTYTQCIASYKRCKGGSCSTVAQTCSTSGGYTCTAQAAVCASVSTCSTGTGITCVANGYTYASPLNETNKGPNLLCPQQITPMTNNSNTLLTAINSMTAQGDTVISQGLQWGWNMLSPRWNGQWGGTMGSNNLPMPYNTPGMAKAIVLLTDGENTIDNTAHGSYWFLGDDRVGSTNGTTAVTDMDNKTLSLCNAMKADNIYIYTIALGTDTTTSSLALLSNCATAVNYYFNSPSTTQLQTVFSTIGDSLSNLHVSK